MSGVVPQDARYTMHENNLRMRVPPRFFSCVVPSQRLAHEAGELLGATVGWIKWNRTKQPDVRREREAR